MNYLQLVQKFMRYVRAGDAPAGVASPSTVVGQMEVEYEAVQFINDAYTDIQNEKDEWTFRVGRSSFPTVASQRTYSVSDIQATIADYECSYAQLNADLYRFIVVNLTSAGTGNQSRCIYIPYEDWRGLWDIGNRGTGMPCRFTVQPNGSLEFDPTPDNVYTLTLDYRKAVDELATDDDEPIFGAPYHDAIVWDALLLYCATRDDTDALEARATHHGGVMKRKMYRELLPEMYAGDFGT